ncbi:DegT/DnrJ/EryC1/StrS family aminotransferase, partial [bacterium]|nr:DegT/DnrJ/EryC1/StrS family aminotransferase [bacterium]
MPGPGAYWIDEEEKREVMDVLSSGYLSRYGDLENPDFKHKVYTLEQEFAEYCGVKHAIATSSGTGSILISLLALGISEGDEVIVPGYTFIASISSIIYARAVPVLAEIDESLTVDPDDIEKKITNRTRAIMPVHMLGNPCNMDRIMEIAEKHNLIVIEDCCQAAGASYKGRKVGSIGKIGTFSLNVFKTITAGDGGLIVTDDDALYERVFGLHDQGHKPNRTGLEVGRRSLIGLNFRINELTGAVALAQLRKIDKIIQTLREKKNKLKQRISNIPGVGFRKVHEEKGECVTLLTVIFDNKDMADKVCKKLGTKTISHSSWHVYNNMEHFLGQMTPTTYPCPYECPAYGKDIQYYPHMLPQTDNILNRAINISVGVVDKGLGSGFGININSADDE